MPWTVDITSKFLAKNGGDSRKVDYTTGVDSASESSTPSPIQGLDWDALSPLLSFFFNYIELKSASTKDVFRSFWCKFLKKNFTISEH